MNINIRDATGGCYGAKVDDKYRVHTKSSITTSFETAMFNQRAFIILSNDITLTSATESAIIYIKNNETSDLVIHRINIGVGASTGGTGLASVYTYINPTGGTIISDENDCSIVNNFLGSSVNLTADYYKGAEGKTFVGTPLPHSMCVDAPAYDESLPKTVIPNGTSAGLSIVPPTSNTSMLVSIRLFVYLRDYI
jgi:hypothetical protein